jgi:hypothetical protein
MLGVYAVAVLLLGMGVPTVLDGLTAALVTWTPLGGAPGIDWPGVMRWSAERGHGLLALAAGWLGLVEAPTIGRRLSRSLAP